MTGFVSAPDYWTWIVAVVLFGAVLAGGIVAAIFGTVVYITNKWKL